MAAGALIWAALSSLYLSRRIAKPLEILERETAQLLDRQGRVRTQFTAALRPDEIGDLARGLGELSLRLDRHLQQAATFAADLAHEIKNPLAGIRSAAEVLGEVHDPAERRRFAAIVEAESARLDALLHAARESAALDAQLAAEPRGPIALEPLLAELIAVARLGTATPIELASAPGAAGILVLARAERLAQVVGNLLDNLVSFSPPGAPINVALTPTHDGALVHFRDRGPGIPAEHLERIFERFFTYRPARPPRVDTEPGSRGGGHTGTGLAIARTIVTAYAGTLRAENAPDGGARFELRLPRATVADLALRGTGSAPGR
jgi:two-component system sensor histidine kinase ChvG